MSKLNEFSDIASTYEEYLDDLYSYALHMDFNEQIAMDAIHDVFFKICTQHSSFNKIQNLKAFLFRSLRNRLLDIKREKEFNTIKVPVIKEDKETLPFQLKVSVEDEYIEKEDAKTIQQKLEKLLAKLSDREREIIFLRFKHEYSYEEIANIMQISVLSCRNLISKSLNKLRNMPLSIFLFL